MKYYIDYEIETANGNRRVKRYVGDKKQIIKAIDTAKKSNYKIIKVDYYTE